MAANKDKSSQPSLVDSGHGSTVSFSDSSSVAGRKQWDLSANKGAVGEPDANEPFNELSNLNGPLQKNRFVEYRRKGCNKNLHHLMEDTSEEQADTSHYVKAFGEDRSAAAVQRWTQGNDNTFLWSSKTFPWEMSLPVHRKDDTFQDTIMFVATTNKSPGLFLFTISEGTCPVQAEKTEYFIVRVARLLRRRLAEVLAGEIPYILPAVFSAQEFTEKGIDAKIDQGWNNNVKDSQTLINAREMSDKGPTALTPDHFQQVVKAVRTCASLSDVPGFLDDENKNKAYWMDAAHTGAVLHLVRQLLLVSDPSDKITVPCDVGNDKHISAILEAVRRVTPQRSVWVDSADPKIKRAQGDPKLDEDTIRILLCSGSSSPYLLKRTNKADEAAPGLRRSERRRNSPHVGER